MDYVYAFMFLLIMVAIYALSFRVEKLEESERQRKEGGSREDT